MENINVFKEFREKFGLTQIEAAQLINVCSKKWCDIENGKGNKFNLKKYENLIKFFDNDLNKPFDPEKTKLAYFRPLKKRQVLQLTGFTEAAFTSSRKRDSVSPLLNTMINAAILAIDEEKNRISKSKKRPALPKMELKTYPAPNIKIVEKKSIADLIIEIENKNEQLEGENAALKLTISTLELQIQQQAKEIQFLKDESKQKSKPAPITEEQKKYLVSIVRQYLDKTKGKKVNEYFAKAFWTDIFEDVGPNVKCIADIKTFPQWLAAVNSAKARCKAIGLHVESFGVLDENNDK